MNSWLRFRTESDSRSRCIIRKVIECSQRGVDALFSFFQSHVLLSLSLHRTQSQLPEKHRDSIRIIIHQYKHLSPNHRCHPCAKWVSHWRRSHYYQSVDASPYFPRRPQWSRWLTYTLLFEFAVLSVTLILFWGVLRSHSGQFPAN